VESAAISPHRNDGAKLINAARKRNGFDEGLTRRIVQLSSNHRKLRMSVCQSPGEKAGRWGAGLTEAKMTECRWSRPLLVPNSSSWNGLRALT
jgi:hypothetical protein